ncbi:hypothetical protein [Geobacter sp. SVR]|uniref:hypothetical protein n=1 Tax=Geobacter sp. SVR TaxID=2495594 RepID=UPI0019503553|nr:hypothetical protein [Geobacter sp. SVR]
MIDERISLCLIIINRNGTVNSPIESSPPSEKVYGESSGMEPHRPRRGTLETGPAPLILMFAGAFFLDTCTAIIFIKVRFCLHIQWVMQGVCMGYQRFLWKTPIGFFRVGNRFKPDWSKSSLAVTGSGSADVS